MLGKDDKVVLALVCILADGHLLVEDMPGLGKTRLATGIAHSFGGRYRRVQGTPDLLPADITGSYILDRTANRSAREDRDDGFVFRQGPVFANVLLCDEINRTPPKTQAALLEAMEERQVTTFNESRSVPDPFFVIATQNPVEMYETYPLPEAQLDRFLMRIDLGYPDRSTEYSILTQVGSRRRGGESRAARPAAGLAPAVIVDMMEHANAVHVSDAVYHYVLSLVEATRNDPDSVRLGASPRASLALVRAARVYALAQRKDHVNLRHIQDLAPYVIAHRLVLHDGVAGAENGSSAAQVAYVRQLLGRVRTSKGGREP